MITWTAIILTVKNIAGYIIAHWRWIVGSLAVLAVLILFGWAVDSCYDRKTAQTKEAIDNLKIKEIQIDDSLKNREIIIDEKQKEVVAKEQKVKEAEKTLKEIERINAIPRDDALKLMCDYEREMGRKNEFCKDGN